jgi:hypothetical protein
MLRKILAALLGYVFMGVLIAGTDQLYARMGPGIQGLIILGELMGVASTVYLWNTVPHYYSFFLLIVYPPAVWLGAKLKKPITV